MLLALIFACAPPDDVPAVDASRPLDSLVPHGLEAPRQVERSASAEVSGPLTSSEAVWAVPNHWSDLDPDPGLAWSANSGLDWNEKYRLWVDDLAITPSMTGNVTAELSTPWGAVPLASLECAESAFVLRASFAAWHGLPFYVSGYSPALGQNVYYGHFGMVTASGTPVSWAPDFSQLADHTAAMDAGDPWIEDPALQGEALPFQDDDLNDFLEPGARTGDWLDVIHANKRVAHLLMRMLTDFGSVHLAHATNVFDVTAEGTETGDVLVHRWQPQGIGHVMIVKEIADDPDSAGEDVNVLQGSMPRVQPRWMFEAVAQGYFTDRHAGSDDLDANGVPYVEMGGGVKRWRTAEQSGGVWSNVVPVSDTPIWIPADDTTALAARIDAFDLRFGEHTPEGRRDALLAEIAIAREALRTRPASCANRTRREDAFDELYVLQEDELGIDRATTDALYRDVDDYVFAELSYDESPSCCWNSTTPEMYAIIRDFADAELADAEATSTCVEPTVFRMRDGGYDPFETFASQTGRAGDWVMWSADEACPQAGALDGVEIREPWSDWCEVAALLDASNADDEDPTDPADPIDDEDSEDEDLIGPDPGGSDGGCGCSGGVQSWSMGVGLLGVMLSGRRRRGV